MMPRTAPAPDKAPAPINSAGLSLFFAAIIGLAFAALYLTGAA